ncbi:MAG TPA: Hsp20/alpha crystallin family protein, partial [Mycobacterium sp.]|nr:Hsp20/alpha crystallin family protein [Mycobacterium sp.]
MSPAVRHTLRLERCGRTDLSGWTGSRRGRRFIRWFGGQPIRLEDGTNETDSQHAYRVLTIMARCGEKDESNGRTEFAYGSFVRSVLLPPEANENDIAVTYDRGILTVSAGAATSPPGEAHLRPVRDLIYSPVTTTWGGQLSVAGLAELPVSCSAPRCTSPRALGARKAQKISLIPRTTSQTPATIVATRREVNGHASITMPAITLVNSHEDVPPPVGQRRMFSSQRDLGNTLEDKGHPNPDGQQQDCGR